LTKSPLFNNKFSWYFIGYWIIWSALVAVVLVKCYDISVSLAVSDSLISNGLMLLSVFILNNLLTYYHPAQGKILFAASFALILTLLAVNADNLILQHIYPRTEWIDWVHGTLPVRSGIALLINGMTAGFGLLWYNLQEQQTLNDRQEETEKTVKEAELYKLRQQLQPHFLFNSLNSINALIRQQPDQARKMVQQLSDFLRGTLKREDNQFIMLAEELEYLKLYLDIEKVRFGYRLKTEIEASEEAFKINMPPLLLQPLMENAIKFGLYGTTGEVTITLTAVVADNYLVLTLRNPYDPEMQIQGGTGFGLKSVRRRLYLLFARNDLVEVTQTEDAFIVILRIPFTHV
jgi:two-component system, LytTR family, sensor kinase